MPALVRGLGQVNNRKGQDFYEPFFHYGLGQAETDGTVAPLAILKEIPIDTTPQQAMEALFDHLKRKKPKSQGFLVVKTIPQLLALALNVATSEKLV